MVEGGKVRIEAGRQRWIVPIAAVAALCAAACDRRPPAPEGPSKAARTALPTGAMSAMGADDGQWTMAAKDYASTRYSSLAEINAANVKDLQVAFTFSTGADRGQEAAPIVVDGSMYIVTAYPNYLFALDLTKPGAPMKWKYAPKPAPASQGVACCDVVNRGAV